MPTPHFDDAFLARQQDYYRARAGEYDEWWDRRGRYDYGRVENADWFNERAQVEAALQLLQMSGDVLELACGTGYGTSVLAKNASVTAVDGSEEMLRLASARPGNERVRFEKADLFDWQPERQYDGVFFGFWLSHVPPERVGDFLRKVHQALRPGGKVFLIDSQRDPITTSLDQPLPSEEQIWLERRLKDGRTYPIVKVFFAAAQLELLFPDAGIAFRASRTRRFFLYGSGTR